MNTVDTVYLLIIGFFTVTFAVKGMKKILFSLIAGAIASFIAVSIGDPIGKLLYIMPIEYSSGVDDNIVSDINRILPTAFGTIIAFILSFFLIRILLKTIEFKVGTGVVAIVINRLLGGLTGFLFGVSIIFVFSFFLELLSEYDINSLISSLKDSRIYNFLEIFKIRF